MKGKISIIPNGTRIITENMVPRDTTIINIPKGVRAIGERAFYNCAALKSLVIPDGVTAIGKRAFEECESLKAITIPETVENIGNYAFAGCRSLEYVNIPKGVRAIGDCAFYNCKSLKFIDIQDGVIINDGAFDGCTSLNRIGNFRFNSDYS